MLVKVRENIYLADEKVTDSQLKEVGISVILTIVGDDGIKTSIDATKYQIFAVGLNLPETGKINRPHMKDIACHIPKYMVQNGETIVIIGKTGKRRSAYVAARAVCEIESRSIYDILLELKDLILEFDLGKAYF